MCLTKWYIFCQSELLLTADGKIPCSCDPPLGLSSADIRQPLPEIDGRSCVAVAIEERDDRFRFVDLRASFEILPKADYRIAGKAYELLYWERNTRYCSVCGAPMQRSTDISKKCVDCGREVWPTVAMAVIALVVKKSSSGNPEDDEVLLVQSNNFRSDYYGLVAGFVETGETLEEAVAREIQEETGVVVTNICYHASQSWPYPSVMMVGFNADYVSGELRLQTSELRKGGWFKRSDLPAIPGKVSLARQLIDAWLGEASAT